MMETWIVKCGFWIIYPLNRKFAKTKTTKIIGTET